MQISDAGFIVTGGASGLGAACAQMLTSCNAHVASLDLSHPELATTNPRVRTFTVDVTEENQWSAVFDYFRQLNIPLRGIVCCAGIEHAERVIGKNGVHDLAAFRRVIDVNLIGTFNSVRLASVEMTKSNPTETGERGVCVLTSSVAAFDGQIGQAAYSASKAGIAGMTLALARDLARSAIRVVSIAPGVFDTPLLARLPPAARESLEKAVPFPPRLGYPSEFAQLVCNIITNPMLNGETIRLDGALRMGAR